MKRFERSFVAMGGPCHLRIDCDDMSLAQKAIQAAENEVQRLERKYSRYLPNSVTSKINFLAGNEHSLPVDTETAGLLNYAQTLWRESGGLFDLTSGVLRRAWDFKLGQLPLQNDLDKLLPLIGWDKVEWEHSRVRLPQEGMELDFGGCVKEYACDSAAAMLRQMNVTNALVDLSGDMAAIGRQGAGEPWSIGIRHPAGKDRPIAYLELDNSGLASSGNYERCMEVEGKHYGHILNPLTGWPVEGLRAVSVVADQCLVAGSTATIAMLKPASEALLWLEQVGVPWLAIDLEYNCHRSTNDV